MPCLSREYLVVNVVERLASNPECAKFVIEAMKYHMFTDLGPDHQVLKGDFFLTILTVCQFTKYVFISIP